MSIFVQMTAYRGFDVVPTVRDCIEKAKDKEGLHFGLCLQQDEEIPSELNHERIKVDRVPLKETLGHGWARSRAQSLYAGQDFTLQIESGCRFAEGWDEQLIQALSITGSDRPLVTNPANKFNPTNGELEHKDVAYRSQAFQFFLDTPSFWPMAMKGAVAIQKARNVSDHFMFTHGRHCTECKYDPSLYYSEIEQAVALRSFTLGYDIFHHFKPLVFRNYVNRMMNWGDDSDWWLKDRASKQRFSDLLKNEVPSEFGLGQVRSLRDFELYSGIDLIGRRLQRDTVSGFEPPCKFTTEEAWEASYMKDYSITAQWDVEKVEKSDDYDYWMFSVDDEAGRTISRQDLRWERDKDALERKVSFKRLMFKAPGGQKPSKISIQPFSKSKGALTKVTFELGATG